jgi:antitoxin component of RelBE/YafQ-DinJ toxin-antitoxin module
MVKNITMAIDSDLLKKARKIAVEKNTTVTSLIRIYLTNLIEREEKSREEIARDLIKLFDESKAVIGEKKWTREELHER